MERNSATFDFQSWYLDADLSNDSARAERRRAGVERFVQEAASGMIEPLVRLAMRSKQSPDHAAITAFRSFFESDGTFSASSNKREMELLAGAALAALVRSENPIAAEAALAIRTASLGDSKPFDLPKDLGGTAENELNRIATALRKRRLPAVAKPPDLNFGFGSIRKSIENEQSDDDSDAFESAEAAITQAFERVVGARNNDIAALNRCLQVQDEELQQLWWLIGRRSWLLNLAFDEVPENIRPLAYAAELAACTHLLPGSPGIAGLFARSGLTDSQISVSDAVNTAQEDWLRPLCRAAAISPVIHPLHFAVIRRLETGPGDSWVAAWAATVGTRADLELPSLGMAMQFYREQLLMRPANE